MCVYCIKTFRKKLCMNYNTIISACCTVRHHCNWLAKRPFIPYVVLSCVKEWWIGGWLPFLCCHLLSGWEQHFIYWLATVSSDPACYKRSSYFSYLARLACSYRENIDYILLHLYGVAKFHSWAKTPVINKPTLFAVPHFSLGWTNMNQ